MQLTQQPRPGGSLSRNFTGRFWAPSDTRARGCAASSDRQRTRVEAGNGLRYASRQRSQGRSSRDARAIPKASSDACGWYSYSSSGQRLPLLPARPMHRTRGPPFPDFARAARERGREKDAERRESGSCEQLIRRQPTATSNEIGSLSQSSPAVRTRVSFAALLSPPIAPIQPLSRTLCSKARDNFLQRASARSAKRPFPYRRRRSRVRPWRSKLRREVLCAVE